MQLQQLNFSLQDVNPFEDEDISVIKQGSCTVKGSLGLLNIELTQEQLDAIENYVLALCKEDYSKTTEFISNGGF